jgi:hypothetical protein
VLGDIYGQTGARMTVASFRTYRLLDSSVSDAQEVRKSPGVEKGNGAPLAGCEGWRDGGLGGYGSWRG